MGERGRLGNEVVPTAQSVALCLDPESDAYGGSVRITLRVDRPTRMFGFHAQDMVLHRVVLCTNEGRSELSWTIAEQGLATATANRALRVGEPYTLEVDFTSTLTPEGGGLFRAEVDGQYYIFSQFEDFYARTAFPCWDEPAFKIPFQLSLNVPSATEALSNTAVREESGDGRTKSVRFETTRPLPTYLLALAVGPFEAVPIPDLSVPGRVVTPQGQGHLVGLAMRQAAALLPRLEAYFDRPYPYDKLDLVAVPEFWWGAMENAGLVTFRDSLLLAEPTGSDPSQERLLARVMAHELAHMWFGNLVTLAWWDDLWLKEAFADWLADKIADEVFPELGVGLAGLEAIHQVMLRDARPATKAIRKSVTTDVDVLEDNELAYFKGKALLCMLEKWLGAATFRRGIHHFLARHAWGTAEGADLWDAIEQVSGRKVEGVLRSFLDQPGLPMVSIARRGGRRIEIVQKRFLNHGVEAAELRWQLPVGLRIADSTGEEASTILLKDERTSLALERQPTWLLPDGGAPGYYRWWLPDADLERVAASASEKLDPYERIAFLSNAAALFEGSNIRGAAYLALLAPFGADADPQVVTTLLTALEEIRRSIVSTELDDRFAAFLRRTLKPAAERFGFRSRVSEHVAVALLRPRLLLCLGLHGKDKTACRHAEGMAEKALDKTSSVDPNLAAAALKIAAVAGDADLFESYVSQLARIDLAAAREPFLCALGWFAAPELQQRALRLCLRPPIRPTEIFIVGKELLETASGREVLHRFTQAHFAAIVSRIPRKYAASCLVPLLVSGRSLERLAAARCFFERSEHRVEGWREQLAKAAADVAGRRELAQRESASIASYLHG